MTQASRTSGVTALSSVDLTVIIDALCAYGDYSLAQQVRDTVQPGFDATLVEDVPELDEWLSLPTERPQGRKAPWGRINPPAAR